MTTSMIDMTGEGMNRHQEIAIEEATDMMMIDTSVTDMIDVIEIGTTDEAGAETGMTAIIILPGEEMIAESEAEEDEIKTTKLIKS